MRSDREEIPEPFTKADADKAETMEARVSLARLTAGCQVYWPSPYEVCGAIKDKYNSLGGPSSFLLWPTSAELTNPNNSGKRTQFLNGPIYWSVAGGAHPVVNSFLNRWGVHGYEAGWLGYPTTDEIVHADGVGRRQEFQNGAIYVAFTNAVGSAIKNGPLRDKWNTVGAETPSGLLGYPIGDEVALPDGQGRMVRFARGVIYWSPGTGAYPVTGRILEQWSAAGYEQSPYGYPSGDAGAVTGEPGSVAQQFQKGSMYAGSDTSFKAVSSPTTSFTNWDTGIHPNYCADPLNSPPSCPVDLSEYDTIPDLSGALTTANMQKASAVSTYFTVQEEMQALKLWEEFYDNDGADLVLNPGWVQAWVEQNTAYPDVPGAASVVAANREAAILAAIAEVDSKGHAVKIVTSTPWTTVGSSSQDAVHSIGRYSVSTATAIIIQPGSPGNHQIQMRVLNHMYDVYDYASGGGETNPAQYGSNIGAEGEKLGIAKPYLVYGPGNEISWTGTR